MTGEEVINIAISWTAYQIWLEELFSNTVSEEKKQELIDVIMKHHEERVQNALAVMMDNLYSHDYDNLKHDLTKIILLDDDREPDPKERPELLRVLWWCIKAYFHGDCSLILDECEKAIDSFEKTGDYAYEKLPFM